MGTTCTMYLEVKRSGSWHLLNPSTLQIVTPDQLTAETLYEWHDSLLFDHGHYTRKFCELMGWLGNDFFVTLRGAPADLSTGFLKYVDLDSAPYEAVAGNWVHPERNDSLPLSWFTLEECLRWPWDATESVSRQEYAVFLEHVEAAKSSLHGEEGRILYRFES